MTFNIKPPTSFQLLSLLFRPVGLFPQDLFLKAMVLVAEDLANIWKLKLSSNDSLKLEQ